MSDTEHPPIEEHADPPTHPNGWSTERWLSETYKLAKAGLARGLAAESKAGEAERYARAAVSSTITVQKTLLATRTEMREGFKALGVRLRDVLGRATDSQVSADEAVRKADEVEASAVRAFVDAAKPHWKAHLIVAGIGVAAGVATAAICHYFGISPLG